MNKNLRVHSIFRSISGERGWFEQGSICTFIRLQGCNLCCPHCDTPEAMPSYRGKILSVESIMEIVESCGTRNIIITGGEPLIQPNIIILIHELLPLDYMIQIETNGTIPRLGFIDRQSCLHYVVDKKMWLLQEGSAYKMTWDLMWKDSFDVNDVVKFVISNTKDLREAMEDIINWEGEGRELLPEIVISPILNKDGIPHIPYETIIDELERNELSHLVGINVQIHKFVNLP